MQRVFAAMDISNEARNKVEIYINVLRKLFPDIIVRWERPEKLHITLKFAGSLDELELKKFTDRARAAAASVEPFRMRIAGTGAFVKSRGSSILWLGSEMIDTEIDPIMMIAALLNDVQIRSFKPHLTIARLKDPKAARELIDVHRKSKFESEVFEKTELVVYKSTLLPAGSVYSKLECFAFGKPDPC